MAFPGLDYFQVSALVGLTALFGQSLSDELDAGHWKSSAVGDSVQIGEC
jgi:hypothetical protein